MVFDLNGNNIACPISDILLQNNLIAHRGSSTAPENTMPAIIEAVETLGFKHVEVDLGWTSDNVCVLLHDRTIDRTSDGTGNIGSMTLQQALTYDFGSWKGTQYAGTQIPTLKEVLQYAKFRNVALQLDLADVNKSPSTENLQAMIDDILDTGMIGNVTICCYLSRGQQIVNLQRGVCLTIGISSNTEAEFQAIANKCGFVALSTGTASYTTEKAEMAHRNGWKMQTWTIDSVQTAEDTFLGGCDWIITNTLKPSDLEAST